jgi:UDP-glucose 4-epimerase
LIFGGTSVLTQFLVTGIGGFIGSHLARGLLATGGTVRGLDNFATGKLENLAQIRDRIDLHQADLCNADAVAHACKDIDVIFHLGALPSVPRSVQDPPPSHQTNLDGTFNLLEGARLAGVSRVVYAASSSAYGNQPGFPRVESMTPQPVSPYAVQKVAGELYMQSYWRVFGLETVSLRYFNIFGPRQDPNSPYSGVMARFILQMIEGKTPTIFGDGEQGRDFTYVDNVVQANLQAASAPAEQCAGRVFNIACGERHTLNETYSLLNELIGFPTAAQHGPERAGDVRDSLADISAAKEGLGYTPTVTFHEGLSRTVSWYQETYKTAPPAQG